MKTGLLAIANQGPLLSACLCRAAVFLFGLLRNEHGDGLDIARNSY